MFLLVKIIEVKRKIKIREKENQNINKFNKFKNKTRNIKFLY